MADRRNSVFSKRRGPMFPTGPSIAPPVVNPDVVKRIAEEEQVREGVRDLRVEDIGRDQSYYRAEQSLLRFPIVGVPMNICTYTVPPGRALEVTRIELVLSEPFLYGNRQFGWRLAINSEQIPNHTTINMSADTYLFAPLSQTMGGTTQIFPVVIPTNAIMSVQIAELVVPFAFAGVWVEQVWATATVTGRLRRPVKKGA